MKRTTVRLQSNKKNEKLKEANQMGKAVAKNMNTLTEGQMQISLIIALNLT